MLHPPPGVVLPPPCPLEGSSLPSGAYRNFPFKVFQNGPPPSLRLAPVLSQQLAGLRLGATDSNAWQLRCLHPLIGLGGVDVFPP